MKKYKPAKSNIHNVARCLLLNDEKVTLCRVKGADWYFLPGGHIENGEDSEQALLRELREEIGENDYKIKKLIGICESIFDLDENFLQQGIDLVYLVEVENNLNINKDLVEHIEFVQVDKDLLEDLKILPQGIKKGVIKNLNSGELFHSRFN